ncbi:uncharacterized protein si:ch73-90k17.1 isoform X1 [Solea solea]|uniref:uncharacterized protein si:ch73-90k17.1 isoform X1 n=1 Tax=Solea solea TaxID=90069 RepID=UPI00272C9ABA|nr:uncharacterized protein si:ch73-90k17.1 isoform X1 [Solea solea]
MSCKQKMNCILFMVVLTVYHVCHSVSLGHRQQVAHSTAAKWEKIDHKQGRFHAGLQSASVRKTNRSGLQQHRPESAASVGDKLPHFAVTKLDETSSNVVSPSLDRTAGEIRLKASDPQDGHQADFTGFQGVKGMVLGPSFDSGRHVMEWLQMKPLVQCDDSVMTFTASGQGLTNLLIDRAGESPISLLQLPPHCGYSVRMSLSDLEMKVPYDACYITRENGSYVLPMLWWDSPVKLSCPEQLPTAASPLSPSVPSVFCSPYGMTVQMYGQEQDIPNMRVTVNGDWGPFVSEGCAYLVHSRPDELTFFIPYPIPCIINEEGLHLQLVIDNQEYILSCPVIPQFPYIPYPVSPMTTSYPPPPPQIPDIPDYLYYQYPGLKNPHLPQVYPPGPQPVMEPYTLPYSPEKHQMYPPLLAPGSPSHLVYMLPLGPYHHSPWLLYHHVPLYYPTVAPATTTAPPAAQLPGPPASPDYYLQTLHYPAPTAAAVTQAPQSPAPLSPPEQPGEPQYPAGPYLPHSSYYPDGLKPGPDVQPPPSYPYNPYYSFYPTYYHPPYPLMPQYPDIQSPKSKMKPVTSTATSTAAPTASCMTTSTSTQPTTQTPLHQCLTGRMAVFLPFAHPDSIQVKDEMKTWQPLSNVSLLCGYMLQMAQGAGVFLHSPLPACNSQSVTPTTISLPLRFWDLSKAQYRTLEPQCPYEGASETPTVVTPTVPPAPPSTTVPADPKPRVICSSHQMTVKLPSGPISGILLKDVKENQISLQDAPKHCGYSASKGKDGKILLSLDLHTHCHMVVQGKMYIISVVYMTQKGRREARFSCPVVAPASQKDCNLPSKHRLPCGPAFVSQPQCLSMGCCFSKHTPACYYPMDECTVDHHFVFSVPASITEPPLSPALLVAADNSTCKPQRVTSDYALFKIPMDGCGARRVVMGKTVIYMVEIISKVQGLSLSYGTITRDSPVRFLVECRFQPDSFLTVSYLVKSPTLGPGVQTQEKFGVQLRIAKDAQYSSYYPQYHQPLQMLLGRPLYLEVRLLNPPDPSLLLLVNYCVAYPRSGTSVWVLLYNGCPNPLDPAPHQAVLSDPQPSSPQGQTRRFTISTFQFLPDGELKDPNEEIYFMCSTEICSPRDGPCVEGCFGQ